MTEEFIEVDKTLLKKVTKIKNVFLKEIKKEYNESFQPQIKLKSFNYDQDIETWNIEFSFKAREKLSPITLSLDYINPKRYNVNIFVGMLMQQLFEKELNQFE